MSDIDKIDDIALVMIGQKMKSLPKRTGKKCKIVYYAIIQFFDQ